MNSSHNNKSSATRAASVGVAAAHSRSRRRDAATQRWHCTGLSLSVRERGVSCRFAAEIFAKCGRSAHLLGKVGQKEEAMPKQNTKNLIRKILDIKNTK